mmetsp:Transcript_107544/g.343038  ORF Transcript_107544/g.343038 Transcript_107544/m.343038 type:complete len:227 (-) Transcript_107544:611-1291(-)
MLSKVIARAPALALACGVHASEQKASDADHICAPQSVPLRASASKDSQDRTEFSWVSPAPDMRRMPGLLRWKNAEFGNIQHSQCFPSSPGTLSGRSLMLHFTVICVCPSSGSMTIQVLLLPHLTLPSQVHSCHCDAQNIQNGLPSAILCVAFCFSTGIRSSFEGNFGMIGGTEQSQCLLMSPGAMSSKFLMLHSISTTDLPFGGVTSSHFSLVPQRIVPGHTQRSP